MKRALLILSFLSLSAQARAEDGYDLWLRYVQIADRARLAEYRAAVTQLVVQGDSPTLGAARGELLRGLRGLFGQEVPTSGDVTKDGALVVGTPKSSRVIASL